MARDPELGYKVVATVTDIKGNCSAGHTVGESFEISCHNPRALWIFLPQDLPQPANLSVRREHALVAWRYHRNAMPRCS